MKTDFSINVNVSIGVTPEVVALVTSILTKQPTAIVQAPASEQPAAEAPADEAPAPAAPKRGRKAKTAQAEAPTETPANEPQPEAQEEAALAAEAPAEAKELTEEDVREAMRRARVRIEGEDWETNTADEKRNTLHRQLNSTFKNIAALLGSDKPSTLPADQRASFIKQCDELILKNGEVTTEVPY